MFDFVRLPNPIERLEFDWVRLVFCSVLFDWIGRVNGIRHNAAPLKHAKEYSSFKPVRATIRMQGHSVWCPMIYSNFQIKTLINKYILRSTGIPSQQRNGIQILPELLHPKSDIYIRKYTPAQLLCIFSKELGGSSFLNNWIRTLISFMSIIPMSK